MSLFLGIARGLIWSLLIVLIILLLIRAWRRLWFEWGVCVKVNAKCPACGNHQGQLQLVEGQADNQSAVEPFVQHLCKLCGAEWTEPTVLKGAKWYLPSVQKPPR